MFLRAVTAICALGFLAMAAAAQARGEDTVECHSHGYKYEECAADFRQPVIAQQLSDSECVEGQSWGYNRRRGAVWVSNGCAAVFAEGGDERRHRDRSSDSRDDRDDRSDERREHSRRRELVECRSADYAFTRCDANWREAELVEQLSSTRCVENRTWGIDDDGLWVDKGCAGRFSGH